MPTDLQLRVEGVHKRYAGPGGAVDVLHGVDLALASGEAAAVVGASGCGKSTLLNVIGSLDRPDAGRVALGETDVTALEGDALSEYRRTSVGFIFQDHHLLPQCTARENVLLPALAAGRVFERTDRATVLLERVGLLDRADAFPGQLSGGERQRVAIARALISEPPLVLCDEPTGNLDRATAAAVADLFSELAASHGAMLLVVTHDLELAARFGRRYELRDGTLHALD